MFGNNDQQNQQPTDNGTTDQPGAPLPSTPFDGASQGGATSGFAGGFMPPAPDADTDQPAPAVTTPAGSDDLLNIKQEALQQLSPLVGHLDQSPEEKFRTTMMMIQASDDQSLLKDAYEAAKQITDEKARAQALLDVVNEINYFTQQHHQSQ
jgi:hypothetical protein